MTLATLRAELAESKMDVLTPQSAVMVKGGKNSKKNKSGKKKSKGGGYGNGHGGGYGGSCGCSCGW